MATGSASLSLCDAALEMVAFFLRPQDACRLQMTASRGDARDKATSEPLWAHYASRHFGLSGAPSVPSCTTTASATSWRKAVPLWFQAARDSGCAEGPAQWIDVFQRTRRWLRTHAPEIMCSLQAPVCDEKLLELMKEYIPDDLLGLWRISDGQELRMDPDCADLFEAASIDEDSPWANGFFGGYAAYDHWVSTFFLPLSAVHKLTMYLRTQREFAHSLQRKVAFACSFNMQKIFMLDSSDGGVYVFKGHAPPERASPANVGLLGWMEEYARRLENGIYALAALRPEDPRTSTGICIVPAAGPSCTRCVTRGVEVISSPVYMPENRQGWTYRISLRLVEDEATRGYKTCQLTVRHWIIQEEGSEPEHVRGEGVIGLFPILADDGWILNRESDPHQQYETTEGLQPGAFSYQSCSGRNRSMRGSFGGEITMVPGTRRKPSGKPFRVRVETFQLCVPDYIF